MKMNCVSNTYVLKPWPTNIWNSSILFPPKNKSEAFIIFVAFQLALNYIDK